MRKLNVVCPICSKFKRVSIPSYVFNIDQGSLLKLPILDNEVCKHKFLVILDYHFKIRDYEVNLSDDEFSKYVKEAKKKELQFSFVVF
jgi:hypothetical protein